MGLPFVEELKHLKLLQYIQELNLDTFSLKKKN